MSRRENQKWALENGAGLDGVSLQLLAEDFAPLDELARQLASRVMRYVVDGAEAKVLAELAALRMAGPKMRLYGSALPARRSRSESRSASVPPAEELGARRRFFQSVQCAAPAFFVRLGRVYEAASRPLRVRMARAFGDPDLDWLQVLLMEATELTIHTWPRRCRPCAVLTSDLIEAMLEGEGHPRDVLVRAAFLPPKAARTRFGAELEAVWERLPGLGASAARHPAAVWGALSQANSKEQLRALDLMNKSQTPAAGFAGKLFELVFSPSKRVRELAAALLVQAPPRRGRFCAKKRAGARARNAPAPCGFSGKRKGKRPAPSWRRSLWMNSPSQRKATRCGARWRRCCRRGRRNPARMRPWRRNCLGGGKRRLARRPAGPPVSERPTPWLRSSPR
jgi:hypothetical protein